MQKEEMIQLNEECFAVEKGAEDGEEYAYAIGELYRMYTDPELNPYFRRKIWETLKSSSFFV